MTFSTVIDSFYQIFSLFGTSAYINSDRCAELFSNELAEFLMVRGVSCSKTQNHNSMGNGELRGSLEVNNVCLISK